VLTTSPEQAFPPGYSVTKSLYHKRMLTLPASPVLVLFIVIGVGASTTGAGCSYSSRRILIKLIPVFIMPARANRHSSPLS